MTDAKLESLRAQINQSLPGFDVVISDFASEDDPSIKHFVNILDVPEDRLHDVAARALEIAFEIYGDEPLPFHLTTVDRATSSSHFSGARRNHPAPHSTVVLQSDPIGERHRLSVAVRFEMDSQQLTWCRFDLAPSKSIVVSLGADESIVAPGCSSGLPAASWSATSSARIDPVPLGTRGRRKTQQMSCTPHGHMAA